MHPKLEIKIKKLAHDAKIPTYQTPGASGADLYAFIEKEINLEPGETKLIATGLSFEIPHGYELQVRPRSGLAIKNGLTVLNTPGTVDADYRGELKVILHNSSNQNFIIKPNERIAQMVICPVLQAAFVESELTETERGAGGFGSTGV